ncbi:MAG: hypothetical protein AAF752_11375 [Bacteroidota bacterium]
MLKVLFVTALVLSTYPAHAIGQLSSPHVQVRGSLTAYSGDRARDAFADPSAAVSVAMGWPLGSSWTAWAGLQRGTYSQIANPSPSSAPLPAAGSSLVRQSVPVYLAWRVPAGLPGEAFLHAGLHASFGQATRSDGETLTAAGYGPLFGAGWAVPVSRQLSLIAEAQTLLSFPDSGIDDANPSGTGNAASYDVLATLGVGVRYTFSSRCRPLDVVRIDGPSVLVVGQTGTFSVTLSDMTRSLRNPSWSVNGVPIGDGLFTRHAFDEPGMRTVTFTGADCESEARTLSIDVQVNPR